MRLFFIVFVSVIGAFLISRWIWSFVGAGPISPMIGLALVLLLLVSLVATIGYLELMKHEFIDKIRASKNRGSVMPGLFLAALYYGYLGASSNEAIGSSVDTISDGNDFGGGDGGGGD